MGFIDFDELKKRVSFADAIEMLGLSMKKDGPNKWRSVCPACGGDERSLVITESKGFFCFAYAKKNGGKGGGDQIALVSHVKGISVKDAAVFLSKQTLPSTVPQKVDECRDALEPLKYLEHSHDAVKAIGLDEEMAKKLGVGYAPKGLMRGTVAWPIRDENGNLLGYIGTEADVRLPPDFMTNVVRLKRA